MYNSKVNIIHTVVNNICQPLIDEIYNNVSFIENKKLYRHILKKTKTYVMLQFTKIN